MRIKGEILFLTVFVICGCRLSAQEVVPASGGNASGNGGSASYSVGQVVYTTITGSEGLVAQGVQQAYEIEDVTSIHGISGVSLSCSVYPNPTTNFLVLNVQEAATDNLSYVVCDLNGKTLENKPLQGSTTTINMGTLVSGTYFVKLVQKVKSVSTDVKTFKVVKK
ncbi:MAG TPA: T9SS type A sorting domain-containing protein [Prolixibacteraceae bacterium]|nr:T9SS type A sorting domain-containing protein [Prolixibacteraceae bacterium]